MTKARPLGDPVGCAPRRAQSLDHQVKDRKRCVCQIAADRVAAVDGAGAEVALCWGPAIARWGRATEVDWYGAGVRFQATVSLMRGIGRSSAKIEDRRSKIGTRSLRGRSVCQIRGSDAAICAGCREEKANIADISAPLSMHKVKTGADVSTNADIMHRAPAAQELRAGVAFLAAVKGARAAMEARVAEHRAQRPVRIKARRLQSDCDDEPSSLL